MNAKMTFMKKTTLLFVLGLSLNACENGGETSMGFESFEIDKIAVLANDGNSPRCHIHLNMHQATEANGHRGELLNTVVMKRLFNREEATIELAAEAFAEEYTRTYQKDLLPLYNQDKADSAKHQWYDYHYIVKTNTQQGTKNSLVYQAFLNYYEGGANSIDQQLILNFNTRTGKQLTLSDIFVTGYEQPLTDLLLKALMAKEDTKDLTALRAKGYLVAMEMFPTENFILGEETIRFIYNPDEIAPYDMGATELILDYSDLEGILRTTFEY